MKQNKASRGPATITVIAATLASILAGLAGPAYAAAKITPNGSTTRVAPSASCPNGLPNAPVAPNVGAGFTIIGQTTFYTFSSLVNENPVNGVPGLIKFCVYATPQPTTVTTTAKGADSTAWIALKGSRNFAFSRQFGDPSNIPLNGGGPEVIGTATWTGTVPTSQNILLHINDPKVCSSLGLGNTTCFVKPSPLLACNIGAGPTDAAYNANPVDGAKCGFPSLGFEANFVKEFGDRVDLAGSNRKLNITMTVLFGSFACSDAGHWFDTSCKTTPGATFTHPITANIYAVDNSTSTPKPGALLATVTTTQTIPYRPSYDPVHCPVPAGQPGKWFNTATGTCQNSIGVALSFTFTSFLGGATQLPNEVIWTVAFNTTNAGYSPIGNTSCNSTSQGCPYDSLNVGDLSFPGAPYAGIDTIEDEAFVNYANAASYCNPSLGANTLRQDIAPPVPPPATCWTGFRPLGEIIASP